jgi:polyisoprenyl-phosphate glycosyltransferase
LKSELFVSVVAVFDGPAFGNVADIQRELDAQYSDYEILLVLQGPVRGHSADAAVNAILANIPCVRLIQLASHVHPDVARAAGFENASGDFVVLFDMANDPPRLITKAVDICQRGSDIVVGVSQRAPPVSYRIARYLAVGLLKAVDYRIPPNATDFRCLSRRTINAVISTGRFYHLLNLRLQKTGYPSQTLSYDTIRTADTRWSLFQATRRFLNLLVFNSSKPLRWMSGIGLLGSCIALLIAVYSVAIHLLKTGVMEGWTTTVLFMSLQFMLMFIILAFISEYMSRILDEQRGSAEYAIVYEKSSAIMVNSNRVNVLNDAIAADVHAVQARRNA